MATKAQLQKLLDRIAKDSRDAEKLARELHGPNVQIFAESDGGLHAMSDDCCGPSRERQALIMLTANGLHKLGMGAW